MSKSLRTFARGQSCYLRLPGCTHDPAKTVLAHIRRGGIAGTGAKPADICAVPLDDYCHSVVDGRIKTNLTREQIDSELLRAQNQWLAYLWKNEIVIAVIA